jgi:hypothetical protein
MPKRYSNDVVLAFGDSHLPYEHKHMMEFIGDLVETYKPDRIVHLGDLLDIYSVSAYPKDIDHKDSWKDEIKKARKLVKKLGELIPDMEILESNHDDRAYKKSRIAGIPREMMLPYKDIVGAPDGWKWHRELTLTVDSTREQLFFAHTKTGGALACAKDKSCSSFIGHHHSKFGAVAFKPRANKLLWGVDVGCLISDKGPPYSYNKADRGRPVQGCCMIVEGVPVMWPLG